MFPEGSPWARMGRIQVLSELGTPSPGQIAFGCLHGAGGSRPLLREEMLLACTSPALQPPRDGDSFESSQAKAEP